MQEIESIPACIWAPDYTNSNSVNAKAYRCRFLVKQ